MCSMPGSSPDVGVVGYTLGGGLSWLGRRYGFACNRVSAIEVVTADGEPRHGRRRKRADLFWALRGGGGGYAIVTALHVDLLPIAEIYAGRAGLPGRARRRRAFAPTATGRRACRDDVTSVVRFLRPPPIPDVPEPLRGRPLLTIDARLHRQPGGGRSDVAPLRELGEPIMDTFGQMPAEGSAGSTWTRSPGSGHRRHAAAPRAARRGDRRLRRRRRARTRARRCCSPSCASSAARSAARPRTAARSPSSTPTSRCSASACR